jgi:hypothetical protein
MQTEEVLVNGQVVFRGSPTNADAWLSSYLREHYPAPRTGQGDDPGGVSLAELGCCWPSWARSLYRAADFGRAVLNSFLPTNGQEILDRPYNPFNEGVEDTESALRYFEELDRLKSFLRILPEVTTPIFTIPDLLRPGMLRIYGAYIPPDLS